MRARAIAAAALACVSLVLLGIAAIAVASPKQPTTVPAPSSSAPIPTPGEHVLAVAEEMVRSGRVVRGSCYDFVSAVFEDAGYPSERREHVFRGRTGGPYADLSVVSPGDWLAIVNHPDRDPVGTHSVIFVRWLDRARAEGLVVSYVGGDADRPGDIVPYDLSRTYRVSRAVAEAP